ncbi:MAG: hypothetical protein AABZ76_03970 [Pseudomonadota bacterium]
MALFSMKARVVAQYLVPLITAYAVLIVWLSDGHIPTVEAVLKRAMPAASLFIGCQLLQDLIPKGLKEVLVFWRATDRLPGHRAFSVVAKSDTRIPLAGILGTGAAELDGPSQNALWYQKYKTVSSEQSVVHESFRYLAWRDVTTALWLLAVGSIAFALIGWLFWADVLVVVSACIVAALLTALAARNAANSLVRNVLAQTLEV